MSLRRRELVELDRPLKALLEPIATSIVRKTEQQLCTGVAFVHVLLQSA